MAVACNLEMHGMPGGKASVGLVIHPSCSRGSHCFGSQFMQDLSWPAGKKFMGNVDGFLKSLINFDKDNVPGRCGRAGAGAGHPCDANMSLELLTSRPLSLTDGISCCLQRTVWTRWRRTSYPLLALPPTTSAPSPQQLQAYAPGSSTFASTSAFTRWVEDQ